MIATKSAVIIYENCKRNRGLWKTSEIGMVCTVTVSNLNNKQMLGDFSFRKGNGKVENVLDINVLCFV